MLKKKVGSNYSKSLHFKMSFNDKVSLYIRTAIRGNQLLAQSRPKISLKLSNQTPLCHSKRILTQSLNITPIRLLNSTLCQTERKYSNFSKRIGTTETQKSNQVAQSLRLKPETHNLSSTYLGHYQIFDYISRTNEEMINKKLLVKSFKEKNKRKKVNYALISHTNKEKLSLSSNQREYRDKKLFDSIERSIPNFDLPNEKEKDSSKHKDPRVNSSQCKPSLFLTNLEIVNQLMKEHNSEETKSSIETELKKKLVKVLVQSKNNPQGYFQKMDKQLKKDIQYHDYQVKDTLEDLRRLQHINDNKLTKKAFILKDIY